ncbi:MAG: nuclear transport factor 2 family protein [Gemmataceae bacterium]
MDKAFFKQSFLGKFQEAFHADDPGVSQKGQEAENVALVRRAYEAIVDGEPQAFAALMHENIKAEILGPASAPIGGKWQGREEFLAAVARNLAMFQQQRVRLEQLVAQGDVVVVFAHEQGHYLPARRDYALRWIQCFIVRDGQIAEFREYMDGDPPWAS